MMQQLCFAVDGQAQPKGSMRVRGNAYGESWVTSANPKMREWQEDVAWSAEAMMREQKLTPFTGPVAISVTFYLQRPKSVKADAHVKKPDLDKLLRCVGDALTGVAYVDDNQVTEMHGYKRYAVHSPQTTVLVWVVT